MPTFSTWFPIWLTLIYLPRILLTGVHWLNLDHFVKARPEKEWVFSGYRFFLILWLPISITGTSLFFQESSTSLFYLYVAFVPSIGAGLVKGLIETMTGIGWFYGFQLSNKTITIPFRQNHMRLYNFTLDQKRVRLVGIIRLVMNTAVLITLLVIQLL
ncbi:MAG: hypothetical protein IT327_08485 [Anaerolineae bacterium]|nr:hypothetical protein [Anaerolineae bacterium]